MRWNWSNWAGNQRSNAVEVLLATDIAEVVTTVRHCLAEGSRVKVVGSGHSFTANTVFAGACRASRSPRH